MRLFCHPPGSRQHLSMRAHAARRIVIEFFLSGIILLPCFQDTLRIYPDFQSKAKSVNGKKAKILEGKADYVEGYGKDVDICDKQVPRDMHLVVFETKRSDFDCEKWWQCIAQTAALHKILKDAKEANTYAWRVISDATGWKFLLVDQEGKLWRTKMFLLSLRFYDEDQVLLIYCYLHYIMKQCFEACNLDLIPRR
jgi:hypothetical protein